MAERTGAAMIKASKIGTELTDEQCAVVAGLVEIADYADGDVVVPEGAVDERLRIVLRGALAVAKKSTEGDWRRLNVLTAGDLVGELAFLDSRPRYAALVALGPTEVFSLQRTRLEALLPEHPEIVYRVMRSIARFAHEVMQRNGIELAELTSYLYKTNPKY